MNVVDYLKSHWFLIIAIFTCAAAYGEAQHRFKTIEEAVKESTRTQMQVSDLKSQLERMDERTKMLYESNVRQERMVEAILTNQQKLLENKNAKYQN